MCFVAAVAMTIVTVDVEPDAVVVVAVAAFLCPLQQQIGADARGFPLWAKIAYLADNTDTRFERDETPSGNRPFQVPKEGKESEKRRPRRIIPVPRRKWTRIYTEIPGGKSRNLFLDKEPNYSKVPF